MLISDARVWLFGAGNMGRAYAKVLSHLGLKFEIIAASSKNVTDLSLKYGVLGHSGGYESFLEGDRALPTHAIVAVQEELLSGAVKALIGKGVKKILVEKPGALDLQELQKIAQHSEKHGAEVHVAYNRRFYVSVREAVRVIEQDGGVLSFNFDFTELADKIAVTKSEIHKENWFFCNSSHVVDLAFYIGGMPVQLQSQVLKGLPWHPDGSIFVGHGITDKNALFSYHANWQSAGRWKLEICTPMRKIILCPLEKIFFQNKGSFDLIDPKIDYALDTEFKPGIYAMTEAFLTGNNLSLLHSVQEHFKMVSNYWKIKSQ